VDASDSSDGGIRRHPRVGRACAAGERRGRSHAAASPVPGSRGGCGKAPQRQAAHRPRPGGSRVQAALTEGRAAMQPCLIVPACRPSLFVGCFVQGQTARRTRAAVAALVACVLLSSAAVALIGTGNGAVELVDEVDGLELNAYLTPNDVEEFKKVSAWLVVCGCPRVACFRAVTRCVKGKCAPPHARQSRAPF
jgi:hypothetical protein